MTQQILDRPKYRGTKIALMECHCWDEKKHWKIPTPKSAQKGLLRMIVNLNDVRKAAVPLEGRLETLHRKKAFDLKIEPYGFIYTPESSGTPERQDWKYVERVIERFNETNSFSPSDYKDITHAASYLLVIIRSMTK